MTNVNNWQLKSGFFAMDLDFAAKFIKEHFGVK